MCGYILYEDGTIEHFTKNTPREALTLHRNGKKPIKIVSSQGESLNPSDFYPKTIPTLWYECRAAFWLISLIIASGIGYLGYVYFSDWMAQMNILDDVLLNDVGPYILLIAPYVGTVWYGLTCRDNKKSLYNGQHYINVAGAALIASLLSLPIAQLTMYLIAFIIGILLVIFVFGVLFAIIAST